MPMPKTNSFSLQYIYLNIIICTSQYICTVMQKLEDKEMYICIGHNMRPHERPCYYLIFYYFICSLHTCEPSELNSASTKKSASVIMVSRSTSSYKIEIFRNEYLLYEEKSHINVNISTLY